VIRRWLHPAVGIELFERLGNGRLVRNGDHPHPAPKDAELTDRVERLRPARDLHDRQGLTLGWPHRADCQRYPVDLGFHDTGHRTMALGTDPYLALRPFGKLAQFLHLGVADGSLIWQRKPFRIENANLASEMLQQTLGLKGEQSAVRYLPKRSVEDQDA